jgi:hypothetical protein
MTCFDSKQPSWAFAFCLTVGPFLFPTLLRCIDADLCPQVETPRLQVRRSSNAPRNQMEHAWTGSEDGHNCPWRSPQNVIYFDLPVCRFTLFLLTDWSSVFINIRTRSHKTLLGHSESTKVCTSAVLPNTFIEEAKKPRNAKYYSLQL